MKKNKILTLVVAVLILFGVMSCGTNPGSVAYDNYEKIVTVNDAEEGESPSTYDEVRNLLGPATVFRHYDDDAGDGYLEWETDEAYVKVTFEDYTAVTKESTGLYPSTYESPIEKEGVWGTVVWGLGWFTFHASNLFGLLNQHFYWLGLLIMTLIIRTAGWPIYAKSNDMSLKMQMAQPELTEIQDKYRNKKDQASQQRMQMETMEIYKKYKINLFGCFMPLLQMPIFIAMYQVVRRFPLTDTAVFGAAGADMNTTFLWTNLGNEYWLENLPMALLVGLMMFLSQWLTQKRSQKVQRGRYVNAKQQQSQKTMKYMMYFMVIMMFSISITNAGIAFYWIIGTSYQLLQSYLSHRNAEQRQERIRNSL